MPEQELIVDGEIVRQIPEHTDYYINKEGDIYSTKRGGLKKLKPWLDSQGRYFMIRLDGQHCLVHRLVALTYLPNPNNCPVVDHRDKNTKNNNIDNLRWCTDKENLQNSYSTMSPTRNYVECFLYKQGNLIGKFQGVKKAARYASKKYGASECSLEKYHIWRDIKIEASDLGAEIEYDIRKAQNKQPIKVYNKNNYFVASFKTCKECAKYFADQLGLHMTDKMVCGYYSRKVSYGGYIIKRGQ